MSSKLVVTLLLLAGSFASLLPASALARTDAEIHDAIEAALAQRHPTDTADWWRGLGPDAPKVIISMLQADPPPGIYQRVRLTEALGWYDDPEAVEYLKQQALEASNGVVKNAAIGGIARSQGPEALDFLEQFLKDPDPQTRYATARALALMTTPPGGDARVGKALADYLAAEKTPWIAPKVRADEARAKGGHGLLAKTPASGQVFDPGFAGAWRGFWLEPASGGAPGLARLPIELSLDPADGSLKGVLSRKRGKKTESLVLSKLEAKQNRFTAAITLKSGTKSSEVPLSAELIHLPDPKAQPLLEVRALTLGAIAVLRK